MRIMVSWQHSSKLPPKQMLFSVLISMGQVPQQNFHPPRSRPGWEERVPAGTGYPAPNRLPSTQSGSSRQRPDLAEEANLSWQLPQGQVPRPAEPPLLREPGAQDPIGLRLLTPPSGGWSQRWPLSLGHWGRNGGEGHHHLKAWTRPVGGLGEGSGPPRTHPPIWSLGPQLTAAQGWDSLLTTLFVRGPPLWRPLTECSTNGRSLAVAGLGAGPTAAPTNGWGGSLTVTQWQLLAWGRSPLQCRPMAERPLALLR